MRGVIIRIYINGSKRTEKKNHYSAITFLRIGEQDIEQFKFIYKFKNKLPVGYKHFMAINKLKLKNVA